jgi:hypothetical protein
MNNKVPKNQLTLTLEKPRERERRERRRYPGPWEGRRRGSPAEEGAPEAGGEARDGGGGFKGEELEQEIGVGEKCEKPSPPRPNEWGSKSPGRL